MSSVSILIIFFKVLLTILYWITVFIIYFYLHEFAGHYLANLIVGIPPEQMVVHFGGILPLSVEILDGIPSTFTRFFGGFISGLILLLLTTVLWRLFKKKEQGIYFWYFAITLGFVCGGFTESIIEGFFLKYHRGALESVILISSTFGLPIILIVRHYSIPKIIGYFK